MGRQRKLSKGILRSIITAAVVGLLTLALVITNIFIPVKYLSSYIVIANDISVIGELRVRFLNAGYGDCAIINLPDGKTMLVDAGNGRYSSQLGILKTLNKSGIKTIDYLICTSVKSEHCGGLAEIVKYKTVKKVYSPYCKNTFITSEYRAFCQAVSDKEYIEYGGGVYTDDYFFCFLSPSAISLKGGEYDKLNTSPNSTNINNASAVIWLEYKGVGILFLSDAGTQTLKKLCTVPEMEVGAGHTVNLKNCNIVQVANHGGEASVCTMFYDLIKPEAAIISVGENGDGSPSLQVMSDVATHVGDKLYRTDKNGAVTVTVKDGAYVINQEKK